MSDAKNDQDGQLTNAEVVEKKDPKLTTVQNDDGETEIEIETGKTVIAPTSDESNE